MEWLVLESEHKLFEEFASTIEGWDLDFLQLSASQSPCYLHQVISSQMIVSRARLDAHFEQRGSPHRGFRTFALMAPACSEVKWRDRGITHRSLIVFPAIGEFHSTSLKGFDMYTISLDENLLHEVAADHFDRDLEDILGCNGPAAHCDPQSVSKLRKNLIYLSSISSEGIAELNQRKKDKLQAAVCTQILRCLDGGSPHWTDTQLNRRQNALARSLELLVELPLDSVCVSDLAKHSGVSVRTLEYAFLDQYSISPHKYLKALRLRAVHRFLLSANGSKARVRDIALAHGFHQSGRFARDYALIFGEKPYATLSRVRIRVAQRPG